MRGSDNRAKRGAGTGSSWTSSARGQWYRWPSPPRMGTEEGRGYRGGTSCSPPPGCEPAGSGSATGKSCCTQQCGKRLGRRRGSRPAAGWGQAQAECAQSWAERLSLSPAGWAFDPQSPWLSVSGCLCFHLVGLRHRGTQVWRELNWEARDIISEAGLLTNLLGDLGQVTGPLWVSASLCIKEARWG